MKNINLQYKICKIYPWYIVNITATISQFIDQLIKSKLVAIADYFDYQLG